LLLVAAQVSTAISRDGHFDQRLLPCAAVMEEAKSQKPLNSFT
jgi:hypothetical protein